MNQPVAPSRARTQLSVSQLHTFLRCPRQYRYKYIDRVTPAFRASSLAFGTGFHDVVSYALYKHSRGLPASRAELHDRFADALRRELRADGPPVLLDDGETEGALADRGRRMVDAFLGAVRLPETVHAIELPFRIELHDPRTGEVLPMPLVGSVDAVVEDDDLTTYWELKTGKRRWSADDVANDLQPTAYRMALRQEGHGNVQGKLLVVTKTQKPDVQIERLVRGRAAENDLALTAASVLQATAAGVDHPVRGWRCRSCAYQTVCT